MKYTEMNIFNRFAVALAAAFIALALSTDAVAAKKPDTKNKVTLQKENEQLKNQLDSLKVELERYRIELKRTDSITNELLNYYEKEEKATTGSIDTCSVEYTAEVSDSLLNMWYVQRMVNEDNSVSMDMDSVKFHVPLPCIE